MGLFLLARVAALATAGGPMAATAGADPEPRYDPLPGKAVGVVVADPRRLADREGRAGPPGAVGFARGDGSFRWVYLPAPGDPQADDLAFGLGPDGTTRKEFRAVRPATRVSVKPLGLAGPFNLVEVEVNGGAGAGPEEGFVATAVRKLDGTADFPLKPAEVVAELTKRARKATADRKAAVAEAVAAARDKVAADRTPTGPEETAEEVTVTWLPKPGRLRVAVTTRVTNGFYVTAQGADGPGAQPTRAGTQFGAVGGVVYEVGPDGTVATETAVPFAPFTRELPPPP